MRCAYGSGAICCRWNILVSLQCRRRPLGRDLELVQPYDNKYKAATTKTVIGKYNG